MNTIILRGLHPDYFQNYFSKLSDGPIVEVWENYLEEALEFWRSISEAEANYAYADGKWTIKEMLLHIIDTDRVFGYRALAFSRGEKQALPGFNHNDYVKQSGANSRAYADLLQEYESVKIANLSLIKSFTDAQCQLTGDMAGVKTSVLALAYVMPGHDLHHISICKERYLRVAD